jgi:hypothetical protein
MRRALVSGALGLVLGALLIISTNPQLPRIRPGPTRDTSSAPTPAPRLSPGPTPPPLARQAELRELLVRDRMQRARIGILEEEVRRCAAPGGLPRGADAAEPADDQYFDLTPAQLRRLAERCALRYDVPPVGDRPALLDEEHARALGIEPAEARVYDRVLAEENERFLSAMRTLYLEATGDTEGVRVLGVWSLRQEIAAKAIPEDRSEAHRRLSLERAGLLRPPEDPTERSPYERLLRLMIAAGDEFEQGLSAELGPARAHELRRLGGARFAVSGCDDGGVERSTPPS